MPENTVAQQPPALGLRLSIFTSLHLHNSVMQEGPLHGKTVQRLLSMTSQWSFHSSDEALFDSSSARLRNVM